MSPVSNLEYPGGLKQYIQDRVTVDPDTGCWVWQKSTDGQGFPKARVKRVYWGVNRLAYTVWGGEIPAGKAVRQRCLNKLCCNPEHLLIANMGRVAGLDTVALAVRTECVNGHPWPEFLAMRFHKRDGKDRPVCKKCQMESVHRSLAAKKLREQMFRKVAA